MLDLVRFEANVVEETVRAPRLVRFGVFEIDLRAGELRKNGAKLKLTGQPFQVLNYSAGAGRRSGDPGRIS
jgi:DNA-binding response OmpR family regulator